MRNILLTLCALALAHTVNAQADSTAIKYAETISKEDLTDDLTTLASDAMEGRETGEKGQKMAAAYIRDQFESLGLEAPVDGSYYQHFNLYTSKPGPSTLSVDGDTYTNFDQVVHIGSAADKDISDIEVVYGGDGSPEALEGKELAGKAVLIHGEGLRSWRGANERLQNEDIKVLLVLNAETDEAFATTSEQLRGYLSGGRLSLEKPEVNADRLEVFLINPTVASKILKTDTAGLRAIKQGETKKIKTRNISFNITSGITTVETENVLGYLEGTDKKDELIVLTAHYDHLGTSDGKIFNGADDDGSGTSAILELAEAFVKAKEDGHGPRRSMLFMTVTGEEKGLLGSQYYSDNPIYPLANTVVDLNIDMIGRIDPEHEENPAYVYLVGSDKLSTELHLISEKANEVYTQLDLDYTYNDQNHPDRIYYRSDHWNFAKNDIPVIFYFNGVHEDYHRETDTVDHINFDMLTQRARLVFYTAWELANREERIKVDLVEEENE